MVRVKVNDRVVEVPPGTSVMDAVFHAGYDVPLFCSERYLSPIGACRMCLVRIGLPKRGPDGKPLLTEGGEPEIAWQPKLAASCVTAVAEGMVVDTLSEVVREAQAGMVEFTLLNHPLDCPTCDKGGACELQDRTVEYGLYEKYYQEEPLALPVYTRFEFTRRHVDKHHPLSPFIVLDRERCIHCKRCVRYFEEIPGDEVLDFIERGVHTFIGTLDFGLPSGFSGNIADICPVGALLDLTARFRARNWEMEETPTTCALCPVGCGITADTRSGELLRIRAREVPEVNALWLCDAGRFGHEWADEDRLTTPLVRKDGKLREATWEEAFAAMREGLREARKEEVGIYLAGDATLEEALMASELAKALGTPHLDFEGRTAAPASLYPAATLEDLLRADFALVLGDPTEEAPLLHLRLSEFVRDLKPPRRFAHGTPFADLQIKERMPRRTDKMALFAPYRAPLMKWAALHEVHAPGEERELLLALLGEKEGSEAVQRAKEAWERAQNPVLILGAGVLQDAVAAERARLLAERKGAKVLAMTPAANARGLEALGVWPGEKGAAWDEPGAPYAYYGFVPPEEALRGKRFLVMHLSHLHPLAERYAHVVLPALTPYEKRGYLVNLEGRVLPLSPTPIAHGEAEGAIQALALLAEALGVRPPFRLGLEAERELRARKVPSAMGLLAHRTKALRPKAGEGRLYLRPSMWKAHQLVGRAGEAVAPELWVHPETARAEALPEGARVAVEGPMGRMEAQVVLREDVTKGFLYLSALGPFAGRRAEARVLVPAGGEA
ncbi:NADH-quinone oxidoreductase subunit NuoG [Thermus thermamylovorans]|uniref:NADH-quinone oxidoreductase n=1 Tax=Thermus thermamylovorans TaxID=2509362 RepID=A0A4Q9B8Z5_9DEIN|nr:NADH-quinone oxidoreductase subunit NuoG [Thermus thermamylovorans]TBH21378.1 NADH dehydrogenase (quinone) subunit G [Thermus thermamylovorans]